MTKQTVFGFGDAVVSRALQHFAAIIGWSLEGRALSRAGDGYDAHIISKPQEFLRTFLNTSKTSSTPLRFLWANEFSSHDEFLGRSKGPLDRSFGHIQQAIRDDGAVILQLEVSRLEFDAFQRKHLMTWLELCGLRIEHESWTGSHRGHLWLGGPVSDIRTATNAERCIEALIRRHGELDAKVTLTRFDNYPRRAIARVEELAQWKHAEVAVTFATQTPGPKAMSTFDFVSALRRAQSDAPRGFVSINHFRERYFQGNGKADFDALLAAAQQGGFVRVTKVPDEKNATTVTAIELVETTSKASAGL